MGGDHLNHRQHLGQSFSIVPASNLIVTQGNVGIGTTVPGGKLHIANTGGGAYSRTSDLVIQRSDATNTTGKISFIGSGGTGSTRWEMVSDADIGNDFGFAYNGTKMLQMLTRQRRHRNDSSSREISCKNISVSINILCHWWNNHN